MRRALVVGSGLMLGVLLVSCVLVSGNTNDYTAAPVEAGLCRTAADCNGDSGGSLVCCVTLGDGLPTLACQASCLSTKYQSCGGEAECRDAGTCSPHTCTVPGSTGTITVSTCGQSPCP